MTLSFFYPRLENRTEVTRNHDIFVSEKIARWENQENI